MAAVKTTVEFGQQDRPSQLVANRLRYLGWIVSMLLVAVQTGGDF